MPFRLCKAPATLKRLMETVQLNWEACLVSSDETVVCSMVKNLQKCCVFSRAVCNLDHIILGQSMKTDLKDTEVIKGTTSK